MKKYFIIISLMFLCLLVFGVNKAIAGSATISWNANTEPDLAGYKIYYGTSPRTGNNPGSGVNQPLPKCGLCGYSSSVIVGTVTTYTFNSLTNGQTYYFSVSAYDTASPANESAFSTQVSKVITALADTTAPTAPTSLTASVVSSSQINLSWTASTDNVGVTGYRVERCQGSTCTNFAQIGTPTGTTYSNTGLSANTTYRYRARATDAAGNLSSYSSIISVTTSCNSRSFVSGSVSPSSVTAGGSYTVSCDYGATTNAVNPVVGSGSCIFLNFLGTTARFSCTAGNTAGTFNNSCVLSNVSPDYYCARTNSIAGLTVVSSADTTAPSVPTSVSAVAVSSSQINLTWTASTDNVGVAGYRIYRCHGSGCTPSTQIGTVTTNSYSNTGLTANTTYVYRVTAYDAAGNTSGQSTSASAATQAGTTLDTIPPANITNLSVSDITQTSVRLLWTATGDDGNTGTAKSYDIRYYTSNITESNWNSANQVTGEPQPALAGTNQSITLVGLAPNTKYYFAIKSSDEVPNISSISNIASATTQGGTCTSFTYSGWGACQPNNTQSRTVISSSPTGCIGGNPVLTQSCTYTPPACTSFTYSSWGVCQSNNTQTRTIVSQSPSGCSGGSPALTQSCTYVPPLNPCTSFTYSGWGACQSNNTQSRTVLSQSPSGCSGGNSVLTQSCTYNAPSCLSFTYSEWGACQPNNFRYRNVATKSPAACTGGNPVLNDSCFYNWSSSGTGGGSQTGGLTTDTISPAKASNLQALAADKQINLSWQNPTDSDFVRVLIVRKEGSAPTSRTDGVVVYEGTSQQFTDTNLDNTKTYYYAIYTYDEKPNYSEAVVISAKPAVGVTQITTPTIPTTPTVTFTKLLYFGTKNLEVQKLQEFLAKDKTIYPEGTVTGYFGLLTQKAVQKFQCQYNIICSGSYNTNGYGTVGPKTRAKLNELYIGMPSTGNEALTTQLQAQIKVLQEQIAQLLANINQLLQGKTQ